MREEFTRVHCCTFAQMYLQHAYRDYFFTRAPCNFTVSHLVIEVIKATSCVTLLAKSNKKPLFAKPSQTLYSSLFHSLCLISPSLFLFFSCQGVSWFDGRLVGDNEILGKFFHFFSSPHFVIEQRQFSHMKIFIQILNLIQVFCLKATSSFTHATWLV